MISNNKITTYIIHFSLLSDRKSYLENSIIRELMPTWIDENLVVQENNELVLFLKKKSINEYEEYFCALSTEKLVTIFLGNSYASTQNRLVAHSKAIIARYLPKSIFRESTKSYHKFLKEAYQFVPSEAIIQVCSQHLLALVKGVQDKSPWILGLEDDAVFNSHLFPDLSILNAIPEKYSKGKRIFHLNSSNDMNFKLNKFTKRRNLFYRIRPASTRNACAYLISLDAAREIIEAVGRHGLPNYLPIDFLLQVASRVLKIKTYWCEPPLFFQGSESGHYKSNFEGNRKLK